MEMILNQTLTIREKVFQQCQKSLLMVTIHSNNNLIINNYKINHPINNNHFNKFNNPHHNSNFNSNHMNNMIMINSKTFTMK